MSESHIVMARSVGDLIRHWRALRGMSQAQLAERTGISARHLSFVETGKSQPSREMLSWLSQALHMPAQEELLLLEAAGFYAGYLPSELDDDGLLVEAQRLVDGLEPKMALIHDVYGTLLAWNSWFADVLASADIDVNAFRHRHGGHDLVAQLRPVMHNWDEFVTSHLRRVHDELLRSEGPVAERLEHLMASLLEGFEPVDPPPYGERGESTSIVSTLIFSEPKLRLDNFISTLGTPPYATLRLLRLRIIMPADPASAEGLRLLRDRARQARPERRTSRWTKESEQDGG